MSESYIKDLRKVVVYKGKRCRYPKNYDDIVKYGSIISKGSGDNKLYKLLYGKEDKRGYRPSYALTEIMYSPSMSYFAVDIPTDCELGEGYTSAFGFGSIDLKKYTPVLEAIKSENIDEPLLSNSTYLAKRGYSLNIETIEVAEEGRDEKGRNGQFIYTSDYDVSSSKFFLIRDHNKKVEIDKSILSVSFTFTAELVKGIIKVLTFLPQRVGEYLICKENLLIRSFGYVLFIPFTVIKHIVDLGANIGKAPILLFVAQKEKYGDSYCTLWTHELKECLQQINDDCFLIRYGKRMEKEKLSDYKIAGTWKELNVMRPGMDNAITSKVCEQK